MAAVSHQNPHLREMSEDILYHLGLGTSTHDLVEMFGDVKFVCMGGTPQRMKDFAHFIMKELDYKVPTGTDLIDISKHSHRYAMYKVGPVISISHGMGVPSLTILLHEIVKLLAHAGVVDPVFFRIGTSGGIGLEGGTVIVSNAAVDGMLRPYHENIILGKIVARPSLLDQGLAIELVELSSDLEFSVVTGKTLCTDDFYEGQARLDGAICDFDEHDKMTYLNHLSHGGVKNIEMEATAFAAVTHALGIRSAIVCVALLNRLNGDQITTTKEVMHEWQYRPQMVVSRYIKKHTSPLLNSASSSTSSLSKKPNAFKKMLTQSLFSTYEDILSRNGSNKD